MLEAQILLLLLHLGVGPLDHDGVASLVLHRVHQAHRNTVNVAQQHRLSIYLTRGPPFQTLGFLELPGEGDLGEVELTVHRLAVSLDEQLENITAVG